MKFFLLFLKHTRETSLLLIVIVPVEAGMSSCSTMRPPTSTPRALIALLTTIALSGLESNGSIFPVWPFWAKTRAVGPDDGVERRQNEVCARDLLRRQRPVCVFDDVRGVNRGAHAPPPTFRA